MKSKKQHWTEESIDDFRFRVGSDFIMQIEAKLDQLDLSQAEFADRLSVSKGRVSQILNDPGNLNLNSIIKLARTLELKVGVVAYDDGDSKNEKGPVHADIFRSCWEHMGKPHDLWDMENSEESIIVSTEQLLEDLQILKMDTAETPGMKSWTIDLEDLKTLKMDTAESLTIDLESEPERLAA